MNEEKELPTLLHLNDDCLYKIFTKLLIKEQLQLANTCERFRFIITHMIWRTQFQETSTDDRVTNHLNNQQYQDLFHHIVDHMEKFTIAESSSRPEPAVYLGSHFPRLIHLECRHRHLQDDLLRLIVENCPKLQVLKVVSDNITGAHIKNMLNLRELYLPDCSLSFENLSDIFKHLNLTHLDVAGSRLLALPFNELGFSQLRYLKLSENQIGAGFAKKCSYLRNLECLTVTHIEKATVSPWQDLFENLGASIVSLKIFYVQFARNFVLAFRANTSKLIVLKKILFKGKLKHHFRHDFARLPALNEFQHFYGGPHSRKILNFISESKNLQRFDLCCHDLYLMQTYIDTFLSWLDIIEVLRKQKGRSTLCLNLIHNDQPRYWRNLEYFKRRVLEDVRYVNQSLLKITFNMPFIKHTPTRDQYIELYFNKDPISL